MSKKKVLIICGVILALSVLIEVLFVHHHVEYWWQGLIGFDIIYGFVGCVAIIVISKKLGKLFIQRKDDYYGGGEQGDD